MLEVRAFGPPYRPVNQTAASQTITRRAHESSRFVTGTPMTVPGKGGRPRKWRSDADRVRAFRAGERGDDEPPTIEVALEQIRANWNSIALRSGQHLADRWTFRDGFRTPAKGSSMCAGSSPASSPDRRSQEHGCIRSRRSDASARWPSSNSSQSASAGAPQAVYPPIASPPETSSSSQKARGRSRQ